MREGFMKTEVGEIPDSLKVVSLGDITISKSEKNKACEVNTVVSVTKYNGIVNSLEYFKKQVYSKELSNYKIIKKGDFAYATIHLDEGAIGYLKNHDVAVLSPMYTVFGIDKKSVYREFLFALLKSNRLLNVYQHIGAGSINRRKAISYDSFSKIKIPLPPHITFGRNSAKLGSSEIRQNSFKYYHQISW